MKVGILTHQSIPNYGACLQAVCTVHALRRLGHEPVVFDLAFDSQMDSIRKHGVHEQLAICRRFCEDQLPLSVPCKDPSELPGLVRSHGIQAVVIGSDAIFRVDREALPGSHVAFPSPFWGEWTRGLDVQLYALAASSMGTMFPRLSCTVLKGMRSSLRRFDRITVRDQWTRFFVGVVGGVSSGLCPDPTVLANEAVPLSRERPAGFDAAIKGRPYVVLSCSQKEVSQAGLVELYHGLKREGFLVCGVPHPDGEWFEVPGDWHSEPTLSPAEWYQVLMGASGYIGSRFHPVVLAMNAGIPFVSLDFHGATSFRSGLFRLRSKTYDYCRQRGVANHVMAARPGFRSIDVETIVGLLKDWPRERMQKVIERDQKAFYATLEAMVGRTA
jgi:hypothetical protein